MPRCTPTLLALAVALAPACTKRTVGASDPGSKPSGPANATSARGGVQMRYTKIPTKLQQDARIDFTTSGGGAFAQAAMQLSIELSVSADGDRLEIGWKVIAVEDLALQGTLAPGDGVQAFVLGNGSGAWLVDRRGVVDEAATDELPANAARLQTLASIDGKVAERVAAGEDAKTSPGAALLKLVPTLIVLPRLPTDSIGIGRTVEYTETSETALIGTDVVLPTETTVRYTLVKVSEGAGTHLAELTFEFVDWGAAESADGEVELNNRTEGTLLFDIDKGIPRDLRLTREESLVVGEIGFDTTKIVEAKFESK